MRTVHSSDGPLLDLSNPSPAPSHPQTRLNQSSPSSLTVPNSSPTSKHSNVDVAMPPSSLGIDYASSPSMDNAPSLSILDDDTSSQASPCADDAPSLSILEDDTSLQALPHLDNALSPSILEGDASSQTSAHISSLSVRAATGLPDLNTTPQAGSRPSSIVNFWCLGFGSPLVNISATISLVGQYSM